MQRLFSTFPNGWPGYGLILLRVICGAPLLVFAAGKLPGSPGALHWMQLFGYLSAVFILAGFWTPFAASCQAIAQGTLAFAGGTFEPVHLILALIGVSLVMLGPGSWSIDARLYGRKRIDLGHS